MKNLYNRNEFLNLKTSGLNENEMMNEGLFTFLGNLFKKAKAYINKIKGGKEIEAIYQKYIKILDAEFKKKAGVDLALTAEEQLQTNTEKKPAENTGQAKPAENTGQAKTEQTKVSNVSSSYRYNLNEDAAQDAAVAAAQKDQQGGTGDQQGGGNQGEQQNTGDQEDNKKLTAQTLKKKQNLLDQLLKTYQNKATTEMNNVLTKLGGAEKNPKLAVIIKNKIDDFKLAFLNAEIKALEAGGDKVRANQLATERNKLAKDLNARWNLDKVEHVELDVEYNGKPEKVKVGTPYRYKTEDGIKTIKVIKKSDEPGKVVAAYTYGDTKDQQQNFQVDNIELDFKPKLDKDYNYFSQKSSKEIKVKVVSDPDKNGIVEVAVGENKFKVDKNALTDVPAQVQQTK